VAVVGWVQNEPLDGLNLTPAQEKLLLGGEAAMWGEQACIPLPPLLPCLLLLRFARVLTRMMKSSGGRHQLPLACVAARQCHGRETVEPQGTLGKLALFLRCERDGTSVGLLTCADHFLSPRTPVRERRGRRCAPTCHVPLPPRQVRRLLLPSHTAAPWHSQPQGPGASRLARDSVALTHTHHRACAGGEWVPVR
jgi:hypothetical protein